MALTAANVRYVYQMCEQDYGLNSMECNVYLTTSFHEMFIILLTTSSPVFKGAC